MNNTLGIPRIGLVPYCDEEGSQYFPQGYIDGIESVGAEVVPIWYETPLSTLLPLVVSLDAMLLSGGVDIDPVHYGQARQPLTGPLNAKRDQLDLALVDLVLEKDIPILAICRGMQLLNVALGGTLKQHVDNHRASEDGSAAMWHDVRIERDTRLHEIVKADRLRVNSSHHQSLDVLGEGLVATAWAEDGVIEAVEIPGKRLIMGLQWHPEKSLAQDAVSRRFFEVLRSEMY